MALTELQPNLDYFYCSDCRKHVPCVRLSPGIWDIQCSRCMGECFLCRCSLSGQCFGKKSLPVQMHLYVVETY